MRLLTTAVLTVVASHLAAQPSPGTLNWEFKRFHVIYSDGLQITLPVGLSAGYVCGIRAGDKAQAEFVVGEVAVEARGGVSRFVRSMDNLVRIYLTKRTPPASLKAA